jgi:heme-degrading monooxygenase HmoA
LIARMWHGVTPEAKASKYSDFLNARAIPDYRGVPGNLAVYILRRDEGDKTHFVTLTFWESLEAIKGFAGEPVDRAKYYPEDRDYLLEFEPKVQHWEVVGSARA